MKELQIDKMMKKILIVILSIVPFVSISQSQRDTIITIDIDELGIHRETLTSYVEGEKIDSVFTYFNTKWNKEIDVLIGDKLVEEITYFKGLVESKTYYNQSRFSKKIFYSKKKRNNRISTIYYYAESGEFERFEFFDRKGNLITNEKKLKRLKRKIKRKSMRLLRKYPLE